MSRLIALLLLACAGAAQAHGAHHAGPEPLHWVWEPWVVVLLALAAIGYAAGYARLRREGRPLSHARALAFVAGMATLVAALLSPLDALADTLFCAHMGQHMLLMMVAPPLLVLSRPVLMWLWAFPLPVRKRIGRWWNASRWHGAYGFLMRPAVMWSLATVALWFWHAPGPYDLALRHEGVHALEHACFFATSLGFWTLVSEPYGHRRGFGVAIAMVAGFMIHNGLLGALLTFANAPLYRHGATGAWGLSPLEDQQLAGLIMWVPAGTIHLAALAALFMQWMSRIPAWRGGEARMARQT
jgi:cytochrome c oxidase assembly factor CtaG